MDSKKENNNKVYELSVERQSFNLNIRNVSRVIEVEYPDKEHQEEHNLHNNGLEYKNIISGIASSTSMDSYGTRMSYEALMGMKDQIYSGLPILPRHETLSGGNGLAEWDEVIGRTFSCEIKSSEVRDEFKSKGFILKVDSYLYDEEMQAQKLIIRLKRNEPIGQSIGGWFDSVTVVEDKEGQVEDIIINKVTLDHIAITRAPANPDSDRLMLLSENFHSNVKDMVEKRNKKENCDDLNQPDYNENEVESEVKVKEQQKRTVMPFHEDLPLAAEDVPWEWNTTAQDEVLGKGLDNWDRYSVAHLYMDAEKNPETKGAYKLPFCLMINGELRVILKGLQAAMGALNGARGGVDVPENEREGIYKNIQKYMYKFGKEAPELLSFNVESEKLDTEPKDQPQNLSQDNLIIEQKEQIIEQINEVSEINEASDCDETIERSESVDKQISLDNDIETEQNVVEDLDSSENSEHSSVRDNMSETPIRRSTMTPEEMKVLVEGITRSVIDAVKAEERASNPEPAVVEKTVVQKNDSEIEKMEEIFRAKIQSLEKKLNEVLETPVRSGRHTSVSLRGVGSHSVMNDLCIRAKDEGNTSLAVVVQSASDKLMTEEVGKLTNHQLRSLLSQGLRAAQLDGLLGAPVEGWQ